MNNITVEKAIEIGIQAGIREALDRIQRDKDDKFKYRHDRRLRNTKLLLRNYNSFKTHCKNAVYTSSQLDESNAIDILDECDCIEEQELYVNSIKKTHDRTYIIMRHLNRVFSFYKYNAEKNKDENAMRGYKAIVLFYLSGKKMTFDEVSKELSVSERTVYRDIKQSVEDLSVLIFGVDGIKIES